MALKEYRHKATNSSGIIIRKAFQYPLTVIIIDYMTTEAQQGDRNLNALTQPYNFCCRGLNINSINRKFPRCYWSFLRTEHYLRFLLAKIEFVHEFKIAHQNTHKRQNFYYLLLKRPSIYLTITMES